MASELRLYNTSQQIYNQSLTSVYRNGTQVFDASVWLARDPDAEEKFLPSYRDKPQTIDDIRRELAKIPAFAAQMKQE